MRVKLVIWDLDDTLWNGNITEGQIGFIKYRVDVIKRLTDHGIINSICSYNRFEVGKKPLQKMGIWDLFIFPKISFLSKGLEIKKIIEQCQLRAIDVLFVDDRISNLEEAKFYNPQINVLDSKDANFHTIMENIIACGKNDPSHSRLKQYKILENKSSALKTETDNVRFLKNSKIKVYLGKSQNIERVYEIISRTNQLNYTKNREPKKKLQSIIDNPNINTFSVRVVDKYGDYGEVGFIAFTAEKVLHFAFSCRILGMGVESFLYHYLKLPTFKIVGDVATPITNKLGWIEVQHEGEIRISTKSIKQKDILLVGGCDLSIMIHYLSTAIKKRVETHFNYSPMGNLKHIIHRDSIDYLLSEHLSADDIEFIVETCPLVDKHAFNIPKYYKYKVIVYSPIIDFIHSKYIHTKVPNFYLSGNPFLESELVIEEAIQKIHTNRGLPLDKLYLFAKEWSPVKKPLNKFTEQLHTLFKKFSHCESVVVLVAAESTYSNLDKDKFEKHKTYNNLIRNVASLHQNIQILDVNNYITCRENFTNSIRHYSKDVYYNLARELNTMLSAIF